MELTEVALRNSLSVGDPPPLPAIPSIPLLENPAGYGARVERGGGHVKVTVKSALNFF